MSIHSRFILCFILLFQCTSDKNVCYVSFSDFNVVFFAEGDICVKIGNSEFCGKGQVPISRDQFEGSMTYEILGEEKKICDGYFNIPKENMKIAIIGDTSYKTGYLLLLVREIQKFSPDIVFHVGDFQYDTHMDKWNRLFEYFRPIFSTSVFQLVAGNHEYDSKKDIETFKRFFPYEGEFFFEWNGIIFWGINTFKPGWYEDFLKASEKIESYKGPLIIFIHKPFVSLSRWNKIGTMNEAIFQKVYNRVSVVFSGHDHVYGRVRITFPDKVFENIISGGGGAYIYGCPDERSKKLSIGEREFKADVLKCVADFNTVLCELKNRSLDCKAVSPTRGVLDVFSIDLSGSK